MSKIFEWLGDGDVAQIPRLQVRRLQAFAPQYKYVRVAVVNNYVGGRPQLLAEGWVTQASINHVLEWSRTDRGGDPRQGSIALESPQPPGAPPAAPSPWPSFGLLLVHNTQQNVINVLKILGLRAAAPFTQYRVPVSALRGADAPDEQGDVGQVFRSLPVSAQRLYRRPPPPPTFVRPGIPNICWESQLFRLCHDRLLREAQIACVNRGNVSFNDCVEAYRDQRLAADCLRHCQPATPTAQPRFTPPLRSSSVLYGAPAFEWLGAPIALRGGQLYRGRYAVMSPLGCSQIPLSAFRQAFLSVARTPRFPADLFVYTDAATLPADWPEDRRDFAAGGVAIALQAGECLIFWEGRATSDIVVEDAAFSAIPGARHIDHWHEPGGGRAPGLPQPPCGPNQVFDEATQRCVNATSPDQTTCPPGFSFDPEFGDCVDATEPNCAIDQVYWFSDVVYGEGKCVPIECPAGTERDPSTGDCVDAAQPLPPCQTGYYRDQVTGLCLEQSTVPPPACTLSNEVYDPATRTCACVQGFARNATGQCVAQQPGPGPGPIAAAPAKKKSNAPLIIGAIAIIGTALAFAAGRSGGAA